MSAGTAVAVVLAALAALAALALLFWLAVGWLGAWRLNHPPAARGPRSEFTFTPLETDVPHESVRFRAADGPELRGWFLPRPESSRVIVAMHGYRGEMSQVLGISTLLWRAGWNVLLFDFRGRGRSDPAPISMGAWETADLAAALEWIEARVEGARVALFGFSMGAVVALLSRAHPRVGAIVADSAFAGQREMLEHIAARDADRFLGGRVAGWRFLASVEWWHRRRGKPPFDAIAPLAAVAGLDGTPLLLIHGGRDAVVPVEQARRLAAAAGSAELWEVADAVHCGAYFADRGAYVERVTAFLDRVMPPGAGAEARPAGAAAREREPSRGAP